MDLTDELFDNSPGGDRQDEQAVILCLQFPIGKFESKKAHNAIFDLNVILKEVIETSGVGVYDGFEFVEGTDEELVKFFMRGQDARALYKQVKEILELLPHLTSFYIIKRYSQFFTDQFPLNS
ncbi:MAG TPA: hypothetical protein VLF93_05295 [Candidatus Saccharimonadales bacterium]|nr:hypothetical protein [Candidatus Saccharimonadales bacterium]